LSRPSQKPRLPSSNSDSRHSDSVEGKKIEPLAAQRRVAQQAAVRPDYERKIKETAGLLNQFGFGGAQKEEITTYTDPKYASDRVATHVEPWGNPAFSPPHHHKRIELSKQEVSGATD
jgi:hypothetical protein